MRKKKWVRLWGLEGGIEMSKGKTRQKKLPHLHYPFSLRPRVRKRLTNFLEHNQVYVPLKDY